jgi:DNA-binding NarL/FixJ family response regulator
MAIQNTIKVIIADDHDIYRDGLLMLLNKDEEIDVVAEANNGNELIKLVQKLHPDIVLTDLRMPIVDGVAAIKEINGFGKPIQCIALSTFSSETLIVEALEAGAMGYVIKNAQRGEILEAVKTVYRGSPYYCKSTSSRLVRMISKSEFNPYNSKNKESFSQKERSIIRLICEEKTSKEISDMLFMSNRTVEGYRSKILEKMKVKTPAGVAIYAIKNGLLSIEE